MSRLYTTRWKVTCNATQEEANIAKLLQKRDAINAKIAERAQTFLPRMREVQLLLAEPYADDLSRHQERFATHFIQALEQSVRDFDGIYPRNLKNRTDIHMLLSRVSAAIQPNPFIRKNRADDTPVARVAALFSGNTGSALHALRLGSSGFHRSAQDNVAATVRQALRELKPMRNRPKVADLCGILEAMVDGPQGEYKEALEKVRVRHELQREFDELQREALHHSSVQELASQRDDTMIALSDMRERIRRKEGMRTAFAVSAGRLRASLARGHKSSISMSFMKDMLVAVDLSQKQGFQPESRGSGEPGKEIDVHKFTSAEPSVPASIHYDRSLLPVAEWVVLYQRAQARGTVEMPRFVLRSASQEEEARIRASMHPWYNEHRAEMAEYMQLLHLEQFIEKAREYFTRVAAFLRDIDEHGAVKAQEDVRYANRMEDMAVHLVQEREGVFPHRLLRDSKHILTALPDLALEQDDAVQLGVQHRRMPVKEMQDRWRALEGAEELYWPENPTLVLEVVARTRVYESSCGVRDYAQQMLVHVQQSSVPVELRRYVEEVRIMADETAHYQKERVRELVQKHGKIFPAACFDQDEFIPSILERMAQIAQSMSRDEAY